MGLTFQSIQSCSLTDIFQIDKSEKQYVIALAGNPNTGKSTVFNALTGLHQHTGNWPGKTVVNARGEYPYNGLEYILVDLPGTYSLFATSAEETVSRDFLCFGNSDAVVVVCDATCLERNLNLVYQVMELTNRVILCINLIDEAKKKNIEVDARGIEKELGIPVILCAARNGTGLLELREMIYKVTTGDVNPSPNPVHYSKDIEDKAAALIPVFEENVKGVNSRWLALRLIDGDTRFLDSIFTNFEHPLIKKYISTDCSYEAEADKKKIRDEIAKQLYQKAETIKLKYITQDSLKMNRDRILDNYVTSRIFGIPLMLLVLAVIFWITIYGANIPSAMISKTLFYVEDKLTLLFTLLNAPQWLHGVFILGLFRTMAWIISVMLPPMAIFFPLFTILEDLGYLPRVAFNMDHLFKKACAHGKQCLSMCMGFGCNAAGIVSCRIIESPRERLIAILTNNFVPCNGRFPTLIAISSVFLVTKTGINYGILPALSVTGLVIFGIIVTLLVSYGLSKTILKGIPSTFTLELPPYRVPQIGRVLYTSIIDRTLFVLWRAVAVAAPAGIFIWILANIRVGDLSIISHVALFLDPFAKMIGLDGYILMAFLLALPANELLLPILIMSYLSTGAMVQYDSIESLRRLLLDHNWTYLTALNVMLFSLLHWPCATTLLTIRKETGSLKWTILGAVIPTVIAVIICFMTTMVFRIFNWA
ncbi:ferrous iron transport protein B [Anaerocolumna sp. MB42-C2]|uniref:ferrous iron transport protein B n=1 Tax=Anaerocolumna sp. MB42-C2 TaxID=3070997 RepID=UPI0027E111E9|nr:ferrous iron transport protein B [Anaerocolumna sp. MB42-C2]WMJ88913.1 ferrous iron transport protein B [Anaerocolumna sp. MB42-C2]